ncbi:MAG: site-specific recombinase XerD, partial [Lentimonas sp.]
MKTQLETQNQNNSPSLVEANLEISEELIWLENFTSKATQKTYKTGLKKFCTILGVNNADELRQINSMHIIKFRDAMK